MRRALLVLALGGLTAAGPFAWEQDFAKRDADGLEKKLHLITERGAKKPSPAAKPLRTAISEREVNSYFRFQGKEHLPAGVLDPNVAIVDNVRLQARALVDLGAVRKANERTWPMLLSWVSGTLEIRASGKLRTSNGQGVFELEQASLGGVPIPKTLLQTIVTHYSITPDSPNGFNLDAPFALPQQIRQVELQRGSAVIVQ
jgi:hypothetical protein